MHGIPPNWPLEFSTVIRCTACSTCTHSKLLRDENENVPQPGYIGARYRERRILLIGQNPGIPRGREAKDQSYTEALRRVRDQPTETTYTELSAVLGSFIPQWPVQNRYFPLGDCGLTLEEIAYLNVVRCRTVGNAAPGVGLVGNCLRLHLQRWIDLLAPKAVIFIGKWAADRAAAEIAARGIPWAFVNRQRSLSTRDRLQNRQGVVQLVRSVT